MTEQQKIEEAYKEYRRSAIKGRLLRGLGTKLETFIAKKQENKGKKAKAVFRSRVQKMILMKKKLKRLSSDEFSTHSASG